MPLFNLRHDDGTLDPLAPFKVLTVMCHPNNRIHREKMLGSIQQETGQGKPRRRPLTSEEFIDEVRRVGTRAGVAGGLLLTMVQLQSSDCRIYAGSSTRRASRAYNQFLFKQREELKLMRLVKKRGR